MLRGCSGLRAPLRGKGAASRRARGATGGCWPRFARFCARFLHRGCGSPGGGAAMQKERSRCCSRRVPLRVGGRQLEALAPLRDEGAAVGSLCGAPRGQPASRCRCRAPFAAFTGLLWLGTSSRVPGEAITQVSSLHGNPAWGWAGFLHAHPHFRGALLGSARRGFAQNRNLAGNRIAWSHMEFSL